MLLADAVRYLERQNTKRPLWKGQRQIKGGLEEPPHPLYPALSNSRARFQETLSHKYKRWCKDNDVQERFTYDGKKKVWDYPDDFLEYFAGRLNTPDRPPDYGLVSHFNEHGVLNKIRAEELAEKLGPIGVEVLDNKGSPRTAFPIAFLEIMQLVIESNPSLKEDHLIAKAVLEYMKYLDEMETPDTAITEACMDVSSLALQKENLEAFRETALFYQLIEQLTQ